MTNSEMRKELSKQFSVKGYAVDELIADRAKAVAHLSSNLTYAGLTRRKGVLFMHAMNGGTIGTARVNHVWFDFETVIDRPSIVMEWAKSQTEIAQHQGCI